MIIEVLLFVIIVFAIKSCIRLKNFPNGPPLLPFIGSALSLSPNNVELQIPEWKKKYGDFIALKVGQYNLVFMCGHEDILNGLRHPNFQGRLNSKFFFQRTFDKKLGFFFGDDDNWFEVRRFTIRYLRQIFISKLEDMLLEEIKEDLLTKKNEEITNIDALFMCTPINITLRILISCRRNDYEQEIDAMREVIDKAFQLGRNTGIEAYYPSFKRFINNKIQLDSIAATHTFFKKRLEERKKSFNPSVINDYMDAFLSEQMKEKEMNGSIRYFSDNEYLSCILDMFHAGSESIGKTVKFLLLHVSMNQHFQDKLHEEIDQVVGHNRLPLLSDRPNLPYVEAVIYEAQRISPIAPVGVVHRVTENTKFKDYIFPKDTLLYFALKYYLNDPKVWNKPEEFMPERFIENPELKKKFLHFGMGKRSCVAELLSKNCMFLYVTHFFQKFSIQLPVGYAKPSTRPIPGFTQGPTSFKLIIKRRS